MTTAAKWKNWWWYHKVHVLIGALAAAALIYMLALSAKSDEPDYHIGLVSAPPCTEAQLGAIEAAFTERGQDQNGDGEVLVQIHQYAVNLADDSANAGYDNYQTVAALDADLVGHVSGIFLLRDPEAFQRSTNGLLGEETIPWEDGLFLAIRKDARVSDSQLFQQFQ